MFDSLTERLQGIFDKLGKRGVLNEQDVDAGLREVRMALLEADVNFKVVKEFLARVRVRAIGAEVHKSLTPGQAVVKIVHEELITTLGEGGKLDLGGPSPHVIMLVGLQGAGKTTTAAKLALHLRKTGNQKALLAACDIYRPAAITQLEQLGKQINVPVHSELGSKPLTIARNAIARAAQLACDIVIVDTAGRLQIDEMMMNEVAELKKALKPNEVLFVADAMTGQEAVNIADAFNKQVGITGLILTKTDGDARGGAAISMRAATNVPIKFLATGEKTDALEVFHPDRLAGRILGMGDMMSLIEKAQGEFDEAAAIKATDRLSKGKFDFEDFQDSIRQMKKMGPLGDLLKHLPGYSQIAKEISPDVTEKQMKLVEAIIGSMTIQERRDSELLNANRKRRIAKGSGTSVEDINQLLKQFRDMQKFMKQMQSNPRMKSMAGMMGGRGGPGRR